MEPAQTALGQRRQRVGDKLPPTEIASFRRQAARNQLRQNQELEPSTPTLQPHISRHILLLRDQRVMLDAELATLYGVETKVLVQAIKRNIERFPLDFMFQLTTDEFANLRSQFVTSSSGYGGRRYAPYAFTELGVAMLSSFLNSPHAIAKGWVVKELLPKEWESEGTPISRAWRLELRKAW